MDSSLKLELTTNKKRKDHIGIRGGAVEAINLMAFVWVKIGVLAVTQVKTNQVDTVFIKVPSSLSTT